jgi:hypothetical protein
MKKKMIINSSSGGGLKYLCVQRGPKINSSMKKYQRNIQQNKILNKIRKKLLRKMEYLIIGLKKEHQVGITENTDEIIKQEGVEIKTNGLQFYISEDRADISVSCVTTDTKTIHHWDTRTQPSFKLAISSLVEVLYSLKRVRTKINLCKQNENVYNRIYIQYLKPGESVESDRVVVCSDYTHPKYDEKVYTVELNDNGTVVLTNGNNWEHRVSIVKSVIESLEIIRSELDRD